jgi:hypothetical protein
MKSVSELGLGNRSEYIIFCVEANQFRDALEKALKGWRVPKLESWTISGVLISAMIGVLQGWGNSFAIVFVSTLVFAFLAGAVFGRWSRPLPSDEEIQRFAVTSQELGKCIDLISESQLAAISIQSLGVLQAVETSTKEAGTNIADVGAKYCVVDYSSFLQVQKVLGGLVDSKKVDGSASSSGLRIFYSAPLCVECGNSLRSDDISTYCIECGSPFCANCVSVQTPSGREEKSRCSSCNVQAEVALP